VDTYVVFCSLVSVQTTHESCYRVLSHGVHVDMLMPKRLQSYTWRATCNRKGLGLNLRSALSLSDSLVQNNINETNNCTALRAPGPVHLALNNAQASASRST
jgi:hypothetical protein